jgi:hypothetical protein
MQSRGTSSVGDFCTMKPGRVTAISKTARLVSGQTSVGLMKFLRALESGAAIAEPVRNLFESCVLLKLDD